MQAVCAKCSRLMCRAVVLFLVAECAQTTPMIAPLPGDPNFSIDGSVAFFKSGESNPTQPNPPPLGGPACAPRAVPALGAGRAVPRGPCPSACPAPVPCSVWSARGGGGPVPVPPYLASPARPVGAACRGGGGGPSPGGGLSATVVRGVWCQALSLPRPPVFWGGQPGYRDPCVPGAVGAGVGTEHQSHSMRPCRPALPAVGMAEGRPGGGCLPPL